MALIGLVFYQISPLSSGATPLSYARVLIGVCLGGWLTNAPAMVTFAGGKEPHVEIGGITFFLFFFFALNVLLALAPLSPIIPTGFPGGPIWSVDSLLLRHHYALAIQRNIIFASLHSLIAPLAGQSLVINSIVSMIICAVGVSFFAAAIQILVGPVAAVAALILMATDRWVLMAAFSANLPVTSIAASGFFFFALAAILAKTPQREPLNAIRLGTLTFLGSLFVLYSYASARIPFALSIPFLALVYFLLYEGPWRRKLKTTAGCVLVPAALPFVLILLYPYKGDFAHLRQDIFASWPEESMRANPGPGGITDFNLIPHSDIPIWHQVARPANGQNFSVIWLRTLPETLTELRRQLYRILTNSASFFPLQPLLYFLILAALFRAPFMPSKTRYGLFLSMVWGAVWISTYVLIPDPLAYRRGIAASAILPVIASFLFHGLTEKRGLVALVLLMVGVVARLPDELNFAERREIRDSMTTVCDNAQAIRALLKSTPVREIASRPVYIVPIPGEEWREAACRSAAVASDEWHHLMPDSHLLNARQGALLSSIQKVPSGALVLVFCSFDSTQNAEISALCSPSQLSLSTYSVVPVTRHDD